MNSSRYKKTTSLLKKQNKNKQKKQNLISYFPVKKVKRKEIQLENLILWSLLWSQKRNRTFFLFLKRQRLLNVFYPY